MKEFLSNAWVISIISGILVFFVTNFFVKIKSKKESKKQIYDANAMILNHIRGYVVDNGLPNPIIIEAVKNSISREYCVNSLNLLSDKEICEELIKDIISNIYISNENKKVYINMLQEYLEQNNISNSNNEINSEINSEKAFREIIDIVSVIAGLLTIMGTSLSNYIVEIGINKINVIYMVIAFIIIIAGTYYIFSGKIILPNETILLR